MYAKKVDLIISSKNDFFSEVNACLEMSGSDYFPYVFVVLNDDSIFGVFWRDKFNLSKTMSQFVSTSYTGEKSPVS